MVIKVDNGVEFNERKLGKLCRERNKKQEFTPADSAEYNDLAERGFAMIKSSALAAAFQASALFPGYSVPEGTSLWAEIVNWACDTYQPNCDSSESR